MYLLCAAIFVTTSVVPLNSARSQILTDIPEGSQGLEPDEQLGAILPLTSRFTDSVGREASLREFLPEDRPSIVTFNYTNCPGLCIVQLDGLAEGIDAVDSLALGKDYDLVSVNIDPRDTPEKSAEKKEKYIGRLGKRHDKTGWHFLTGSNANILKICKAAGFKYNYDASADQYNHMAVAVVVSPEGKIVRYLYDIRFEPDTLKLSLLEAAEGKIGTPFEQFMLWCSHYDPMKNRYSADAMKLLSIAAGAFVLLVMCTVAPFWFLKVPNVEIDQSEIARDGSQSNTVNPG